MRINPAPFLAGDDLCALGHEIERGEGQHQTQPRQRLGIADERTLQLKAIGCVSSEVLFNVKAPAVFYKRVHASGVITDDVPRLPVAGMAG
jgi:hypothetical protein